MFLTNHTECISNPNTTKMSEDIILQLETMLGLMEVRRELLQLIRVERERLRWEVEATREIKRALGMDLDDLHQDSDQLDYLDQFEGQVENIFEDQEQIGGQVQGEYLDQAGDQVQVVEEFEDLDQAEAQAEDQYQGADDLEDQDQIVGQDHLEDQDQIVGQDQLEDQDQYGDQHQVVEELEDQDQTHVQGHTCCVCYDHPTQVTLLPCGHNNLCEPCARTWNETPVRFGGGSCPNCRTFIDGVVVPSVEEHDQSDFAVEAFFSGIVEE